MVKDYYSHVELSKSKVICFIDLLPEVVKSKVAELGRRLKTGIANVYTKVYILKELSISDLEDCLKEEFAYSDLISLLRDVSSSLTYVLKILSCLAKKAKETELVKFYEMLENIAKDDEDLNAAFRATNVNTGDLLDEIKRAIDSFDPEKWDGDPLAFPAVNIILSNIKDIEEGRLTEFKIEILDRFPKIFENYYDEKEKTSRKQTLQRHLNEMKALAEYKFLEDLEDEIGYIPPIKEYYQPNPCVKRDTESWETGPVRQSSEMNIEDVVEIFLKSENKVLLLAADFGTGKTTASRILASKYAEDFGKVNSNNYIPVFLKLVENSKEDIEAKLDEITMISYQRILLILDGLDEITSEERDKIISFVSECRNGYPNIKIIITTRFGIYLDKSKGKFFRNIGLKQLGHFYQLMPLTEKLAENMLEKLGGLSLDEVRKLGISEEEYTKPIYLYLLWVLKKAGKLEMLRSYGKSGIYLALTNLVSRYKAKCVEDKEVEFEEEKDKKARNVLMHIAALRTIFESEELSKEEIKELLSDDIRKDLDKIGTDFLITTYLKDPSNLTFIHKSFQEYLTAEYLFVSFLSGHFEGFYLFPVTQEIFDFLKGLVKMFRDYWKNNKLNEFRELLEIADINPDKEEIKEKIDKRVKRAKEVLEGKEFYIIFDIKFKNSESENKIELYYDKKKDPEEAVIKYLTIKDDERKEYSIVEIYRKNVAGFNCEFHRISICDIKSIAKNFVSGSIAFMEVCQIITNYKFLKSISEALKNAVSQLLRINKKIHSIDLVGADLSGAKLSGAILSEAILSWADLSEAILRNVNWKGSGLFKPPSVKGANFENAKINDREFVEYLRKNGAKNVPDPVED